MPQSQEDCCYLRGACICRLFVALFKAAFNMGGATILMKAFAT
jgi:hypothetical protein